VENKKALYIIQTKSYKTNQPTTKMTTAHRPTWKAAVGRAQEGGWSSGGAISTQSSSRDLASHTKLKYRQGAQRAVGGDNSRALALQQSLLKMKEEEEKAELSAKRVVKMGRERLLLEHEEKNEEEGRLKLLQQTADVDEEQIRAKYDDEDDDNDDEEGGGKGGRRWSDLEGGGDHNLQSDESDLDASEDDDDDSDLDDDSDEEAALQAELAKIRQERAAAKAKEEAEAAAFEQAQMEEAALTGNPLLNNNSSAAASSSGRLKRRWNDDVVFRNQAKTEPDQNKKRFINDTVRNDFHKRFLDNFTLLDGVHHTNYSFSCPRHKYRKRLAAMDRTNCRFTHDSVGNRLQVISPLTVFV
jgi:protein CWC15